MCLLVFLRDEYKKDSARRLEEEGMKEKVTPQVEQVPQGGK